MENVKEFIAKAPWKATNHAGSHEYIHTSKVPVEDITELIDQIKRNGVNEKFGKSTYKYLYLDGYKYWYCRDFQGTGWCVNRAAV